MATRTAWFVCVSASFLVQGVAQQPTYQEWAELLQERMAAGRDLIELRYRRDAHGLFEVAGAEHGATPFHPLFAADRLPQGTTMPNWWLTAFALLADGDAVLGATDAERHLRRIGVEPAAVAVRQFLVTEISADPVRARVETLDRMVAIDWLQRGRHRGAVAELSALVSRNDTPPMLAARATTALAAFGHGDAKVIRTRLRAEALRFPVAADCHVAIDHARLPDLGALRELARRVALDGTYHLVRRLRAPTADDLYPSQLLTDLVGELPFEIVRRFGEVRFDHTVLSLLLQASESDSPTAGVHLQATGSFDADRVATALAEVAFAEPPARAVERLAGKVVLKWRGVEGELGATTIVAHSKGMGGREDAALARELVADHDGRSPAITVVVPATSKALALLLPYHLPPVSHAVLTLSFVPQCTAELSLTTRDEEAATAMVERGNTLLATGVRELSAMIERQELGKDGKALVDAVAATKFAADGGTVRVTAVCGLDALLRGATAALLLRARQ